MRRTPSVLTLAPLVATLALAGALVPGAARAAAVSGRLATPTGSLPALTVYAWSLAGAQLYSVTAAEGQASYTLELPPGRYYLFAAPAEPGAPSLYGAYTARAACARAHAHGECAEHGLAALVVGARRLEHVDLADWYLDAAVTATLDRLLGRPDAADLPDSALGAPRFSEYPAAPWSGAHALALAGLPEEAFASEREELAAALGARANFAGRAALVTLGCGAGCARGAIVDLPTGRVALPAALEALPEPGACGTAAPVTFRRDSRLLTVTGRDGGQLVTRYLVWEPESGTLRAVATLTRLSADCPAPR
jgi:hypothetical protein